METIDIVVVSRDLLESSSEVACELCGSSGTNGSSSATFSFVIFRFLFVTRDIPGVTAGVFGTSLFLTTRGVSGTGFL